MNNVALLNLSKCSITDIDESFMKIIIQSAKKIDISVNELQSLPQTIQKVNGTIKLWISGNPYQCSCDMMWMKDWLTTTRSVVDKDNVTCTNGKIKGTN